MVTTSFSANWTAMEYKNVTLLGMHALFAERMLSVSSLVHCIVQAPPAAWATGQAGNATLVAAQERWRLASSAESATRQRMRQGEALEKETRARALIESSGVRLQALLGRGQGAPPSVYWSVLQVARSVHAHLAPGKSS